jgi:release factor glutamine methyltransferase
MMRFPGVYRPQGDTLLLAEQLRGVGLRPGHRVLDLCAGTGVLAVTAARAGAGPVTAVDIEGRAVLAARLNAWLRRVPVRVLRGDLFSPVAGEVFDVIVTNPPYVPGPAPAPGRARAWDAGPGGRAVIDRICASTPVMLAAGGTLLMVQSALSGVTATVGSLRAAGLKASVVARRTQPFGPVLRSRAALLERRGLVPGGQRHEELVVIRADQI